jgi:hypothetical protein
VGCAPDLFRTESMPCARPHHLGRTALSLLNAHGLSVALNTARSAPEVRVLRSCSSRGREPGQKSVARPVRPRCLQDFRALATCRLHAIDARGAPGAPGEMARGQPANPYGLPRLQAFSSCLMRRSLHGS